MTAEHLRPMLESGQDTELLASVADTFAKGEVPQEIVDAIRMGRMTALRKLDGGIRGIVVGDLFRRLVSRTLAKQFVQQVEDATAPFQYALKTRAGCECVAHIFQSLTEVDPSTTVISVDGVGAFDMVSRAAMLSGLLDMEEGERLLPFVRMFYSQPSSYLFDDEAGETHTVQQGEGGEQGDALMPLFFSLGQQRALRAIAGELQAGGRLFAFLDDLYVSCQPARVAAVHRSMRIELWRHSKISVHHGKTKLWNKAGILPSGVEELQQLSSSVDEDAVVWRGNPQLQTSRQGIKILGTPIGHEDFVRTQLMARRTDHDVLLERIPCHSRFAGSMVVAVLLRLRSCQFCVAHSATRVGWRILCFARRSNLEVPHDDSRSAGVSRPRVDVQDGVTPSLSGRPRFAEHIKDTHRRVLGELGGWVGNGPEAPS